MCHASRDVFHPVTSRSVSACPREQNSTQLNDGRPTLSEALKLQLS